MELNPLVSVLMPYYNARATLPLALASLLAQTYARWECIIVDDGSSEPPDPLVKSLGDPRIQLLRSDRHLGRGATRQLATNAAQGTYLCMLDADDWYYPEKLEKQLNALLAHPELAGVSTGMAIVGPDEKLKGLRRISDGTSLAVFSPLARPMPLVIPFAPSMMRAECVREIPYDPSLQIAEDFDYLVQVRLRYPWGVLSDCTYAYTEVQTTSLRKILGRLRANLRTFSKFEKDFPIAARLEKLRCMQKAALYSVAYATGLGGRLYAHGIHAPDEQDHTRFYEAQCTVNHILRSKFHEMIA